MSTGRIWMLNCWHVAAFSSELKRELMPRRLLDEAIVLYRDVDGAPVAMQDRCPHRLVPLSMGRLGGTLLHCGYHGMAFDREGACKFVPAQKRIPGGATVRTYPVVDRHDMVWIWMGAKELADVELIPDVHWMSHPGWASVSGYKHMACDYRLVNDNLLDLSHEAFVHQGTIGNGAGAEELPKVYCEGNRIIYAHREMPDIDPPPFFARVIGHSRRINRWQTAVYMPPGLNMTEAGAHEAGTPRNRASVWRVFHMITPETQATTHYFWVMARNFRLDDPELDAEIAAGVSATFDEDKLVLELQMQALAVERPATFPSVALMVDEAPVRARRMLAKQIEREREDDQAVFVPEPLGKEPYGSPFVTIDDS